MAEGWKNTRDMEAVFTGRGGIVSIVILDYYHIVVNFCLLSDPV